MAAKPNAGLAAAFFAVNLPPRAVSPYLTFIVRYDEAAIIPMCYLIFNILDII
jgi:hypothetical protein